MSAVLREERSQHINGLPLEASVDRTQGVFEIDFSNTESFFAAIKLIFNHRLSLTTALIFMLAAQNREASGTFSSTFRNEQSKQEVRKRRITQVEQYDGEAAILTGHAQILVEMLRDDFIRDLYLALEESIEHAAELSGTGNETTLLHAAELTGRIPEQSHDFLRALYLMALTVESGVRLFAAAVIEYLKEISTEAEEPPNIGSRPYGINTNMSEKNI